jgi:hypothetical protein
MAKARITRVISEIGRMESAISPNPFHNAMDLYPFTEERMTCFNTAANAAL